MTQRKEAIKRQLSFFSEEIRVGNKPVDKESFGEHVLVRIFVDIPNPLSFEFRMVLNCKEGGYWRKSWARKDILDVIRACLWARRRMKRLERQVNRRLWWPFW